MNKIITLILLSVSISSFAGNGVERGSITVLNNFNLDRNIQNYLHKGLQNCAPSIERGTFKVKDLRVFADDIDQGITDYYYSIDLVHENNFGVVINEVSVEVEDSDYSNYRKYEERLSLKLIKDKNNFCTF